MSGKSATETKYCPHCERELDDYGNCPKHWPTTYDKLTAYRRQTIINRVALRTSIAEQLLTILDYQPIAKTVTRLLDALRNHTS